MNFKRIFSSFLLFALITSSISIPTPSLADTCTASARFGTSGVIHYNEGRIMDVVVNVSNGCKDKKVELQIFSFQGMPSTKKVNGLLDTVDVPTDQGTVVSMKYKIAEKSCYYFHEDDLDQEETDDLAKNVLGLGGKDELYTLIKPLFTQGESAAKLKQYNDENGGSWFEDYDMNNLTLENVSQLVEDTPGTTQVYEEGPNKGEGKDDVITRYILSKLGVYGCNYGLKLQINDSDGTSNHITVDSPSELHYFCSIEPGIILDESTAITLCDDKEWTQAAAFTPGIRPTLVTESLCVKQDESGSGYDEDCYETLAPIPGFGRKLNFSEDGAKGTPFTLGTYIGTVVKIAIGASSVAAVLFLTYAGVMYMIAGKSGGGALLDKARKRLFSVGWGLLVILASWIILNTINPELLKINPVIKKITLEAPDSGVFLNKIEGNFNGLIPGAPGERRDKGTVQRGTKTTPSQQQQQLLDKVNKDQFISVKSIGFKMSDSGSDLVDPLLGAKLKVFYANLKKVGISSGSISEAWKPTTYIHISPCHYLGTCIDFNISPEDEKDINKVGLTIKAAVDAKLIPVLEVFSDAEVKKYVDSGINKNFVMAAKITGVHFSIYDTVNK